MMKFNDRYTIFAKVNRGISCAWKPVKGHGQDLSLSFLLLLFAMLKEYFSNDQIKFKRQW